MNLKGMGTYATNMNVATFEVHDLSFDIFHSPNIFLIVTLTIKNRSASL